MECGEPVALSVYQTGARLYSFRRQPPIYPAMKDAEKRCEPRLRSRGIVSLQIEGRDLPVPSIIIDVSPSGLGLGLEAAESVEKGTVVVIDGVGFAALGTVRYCAHVGSIFRIGIELKPLPAD